MWLIITFIFAVLSTIGWYITGNKYRLDFLSSFLWGATLMWLVDHIVAYISENEGLEMSQGAVVLGVVVVITALSVWGVVYFYTQRFHTSD